LSNVNLLIEFSVDNNSTVLPKPAIATWDTQEKQYNILAKVTDMSLKLKNETILYTSAASTKRFKRAIGNLGIWDTEGEGI